MTTKDAAERWTHGRDSEDGTDDARALSHDQRMERMGLTRCEECDDWSSDCVPCVREVHRGDDGTGWANHDVPVRCGNLCGQCREEQCAVPEADF